MKIEETVKKYLNGFNKEFFREIRQYSMDEIIESLRYYSGILMDVIDEDSMQGTLNWWGPSSKNRKYSRIVMAHWFTLLTGCGTFTDICLREDYEINGRSNQIYKSYVFSRLISALHIHDCIPCTNSILHFWSGIGGSTVKEFYDCFHLLQDKAVKEKFVEIYKSEENIACLR